MTKNKYNKINPIVKTTDEHGQVHTFKLVEIFEVNDNEYGLFKYLNNPLENTGETEEDSTIVMKILTQNDESYFQVIEDEEEFNAVLDYIEEHEDELEFE